MGAHKSGSPNSLLTLFCLSSAARKCRLDTETLRKTCERPSRRGHSLKLRATSGKYGKSANLPVLTWYEYSNSTVVGG